MIQDTKRNKRLNIIVGFVVRKSPIILAIVFLANSCLSPTIPTTPGTPGTPGTDQGETKTPLYGMLKYSQSEYLYQLYSVATIRPRSVPTILNTESIEIPISYSIKKTNGINFSPEPTIDSRNGDISINSITNTGTASYEVLVSAADPSYETQKIILTLTIQGFERNIKVSTYYSQDDELLSLPVELGQAIVDDSSKSFTLQDTDIILEIVTPGDGEYTLPFGTQLDMLSNMLLVKQSSEGIIQILKSDLMDSNFPFEDESEIAMIGPGILDIVHIATYHPSNIYDTHDLQAMRHRLDGNYILQNQLVFTPLSDETASNFEAVGTDDTPFTGSLDGGENTYIITGVQIYKMNEEAEISGTEMVEERGNYQGLFGVVEADSLETVVVQNLKLRDFKISANAYVGSLAGWVKRGTVQYVYVLVSSVEEGKVEVLGSTGIKLGLGGGLIGSTGINSSNQQVLIQNTSSQITVVGSGEDSDEIGGLVGKVNNGVTLRDSIATGNVTGKARVGGLVGSNNASGIVSGIARGTVNGTSEVGSLLGYNLGMVTGNASGTATGSGKYVGGLVGSNFNGTVTGFAKGDVSGTQWVGGLLGYNINGTVTGFAKGDVSGTQWVGGLVGNNFRGTVRGYATGVVTGNQRVGGLVGENGSTGTVTGYAIGEVKGIELVGGLVGNNANTVVGYARGKVRRTNGTMVSIGKTIGGNTGTESTYHSEIESKILNGKTGENELTGTTGVAGTGINFTNATVQSDFNSLSFGSIMIEDIGKWIWLSDKWPAINIGDLIPIDQQDLDR